MVTPPIDIARHQSATQPVKLLLTPNEAAAALGIKRTLMYSLLMSDQVFSVKVGGARRIPLRALHDYVDHLCGQ
jgi:excisionase family DNA binding protein